MYDSFNDAATIRVKNRMKRIGGLLMQFPRSKYIHESSTFYYALVQYHKPPISNSDVYESRYAFTKRRGYHTLS